MEFYAVGENFARSFVKSFNSQRDGILRLLILRVKYFVSLGFNSQRDGILLLFGALKLLFALPVSIPNGMEFYRRWNFWFRKREAFQFPTGWNSTLARFCSSVVPWSFNSQRDGILRVLKHNRANFDFVSIPNGMEFYNRHPDYVIRWTLFQFPTGWNSTLSNSLMNIYTIVSIPNGMEFY